MIKIRNTEGGSWIGVSRQEALEYACKYVFKDKIRNLRKLGFF